MNDAMSALRARREEIARAIEKLKNEDQELATAEAVLSRLGSNGARQGGMPATSGAGRGMSSVRAAQQVRGAPRSQRSLVIQTLASCDPPWLKSGEIVEQVKERYGVKIPERSLRPLLSAMKRERIIARSGRQVALSERL
jgi:hypothetical protein